MGHHYVSQQVKKEKSTEKQRFILLTEQNPTRWDVDKGWRWAGERADGTQGPHPPPHDPGHRAREAPGLRFRRHLLSRAVPAGNQGTSVILLPAHLYKHRFGANKNG